MLIFTYIYIYTHTYVYIYIYIYILYWKLTRLARDAAGGQTHETLPRGIGDTDNPEIDSDAYILTPTDIFYIYIYIYIYTTYCVYIYIYMHIHVCVCIYIYIHVYRDEPPRALVYL